MPTHRLTGSIVVLPYIMILFIMIYLYIAILRFSYIVLKILYTNCIPINLKTIGLDLFSKYLDPWGCARMSFENFLIKVSKVYQVTTKY